MKREKKKGLTKEQHEDLGKRLKFIHREIGDIYNLILNNFPNNHKASKAIEKILKAELTVRSSMEDDFFKKGGLSTEVYFGDGTTYYIGL